nr:hypothetical protein [Tanacetum cinerariifolium]
MYFLLNPPQREELENELKSREELAIFQVEFTDMEDMPSEAVEKRMDANVPDEIDGAKGEQVPKPCC